MSNPIPTKAMVLHWEGWNRCSDAAVSHQIISLVTDMYDFVFTRPFTDADLTSRHPCDVWNVVVTPVDGAWEPRLFDKEMNGVRKTIQVGGFPHSDYDGSLVFSHADADESRLHIPYRPVVPIRSSYGCPRDYAFWVSSQHMLYKNGMDDSARESIRVLEYELLPELYECGVRKLILANGTHRPNGICGLDMLPSHLHKFEIEWRNLIPPMEYHRLVADSAAFILSDARQRTPATGHAVGYGVPVLCGHEPIDPVAAYGEYMVSESDLADVLQPHRYEERAHEVHGDFGYEAILKNMMGLSSLRENGEWL